jgi:hypothetical protein
MSKEILADLGLLLVAVGLSSGISIWITLILTKPLHDAWRIGSSMNLWMREQEEFNRVVAKRMQLNLRRYPGDDTMYPDWDVYHDWED